MQFRLYDYLPILLMFIVAGGFAVGNILLSQLVGQRKRTRTKLMPYECGKDPVGSARERFSVKFYLTALLFMLFDLEVVILIPWTFIYREFLANHIAILGPILFFLGVLILGLFYEIKKGALQWEK